MVDRTKLQQLIKSYQTTEPQESEEPSLPLISDTSAVSSGERFKLATVDDPAKKIQMLMNMGFSKDQILTPEQSPVKDFAILDKGVVYPIDIKGTPEFGDIAEALPSTIKATGSTLGALGGAALGSLGSPAGTVAGGVAGGAAGAGLSDVILQKLASGQVDYGQTGREAVLGGATSLLPGSSNLLSATAGKQTFGKALEKMAAAQLGKKIGGDVAAKNVNKLINVVDPIKGELSERTLKDVVGNRYVNERTQSLITTEADTLAGRAAEAVKNFYDKELPVISRKIYEKVPNEQMVNVGESLFNVQNVIGSFKENATSSQLKGVSKLEKLFQEMTNTVSPEGQINFGKLKSFINDIYETSAKLRKSDNNYLASQYEQSAGALRSARDAVPEIQKATNKFKNLKSIEDFFHDFMRIETARGEVNLQQKIQSMSKNDGVRQRIHELWRVMHRYSETKPYAEIMDKIKLAQVAADIKAAKAVKPSGEWINRVPFLKELANVNPFTSPEEGMKALAMQARAGIIKPTALEKQIPRVDIPIIGNAITRAKAQAAMYGMPIAPTPRGLTAGLLEQLAKGTLKTLPKQIQMPAGRELFRQLNTSGYVPRPQPQTNQG